MDLERGNTGGVEPQERGVASTGLGQVCDDDTIPMVCVCVLCVGVQCNIPQRLYIHLFEKTSQNSAILAKKYYICTYTFSPAMCRDERYGQ